MKLSLAILILSIMAAGITAQDVKAPAPPPPKDAEEEPKITVRGRVFYAESGMPLRRSWIGLVRIMDPEKDEKGLRFVDADLSQYDFSSGVDSVLTNDFGEFELPGRQGPSMVWVFGCRRRLPQSYPGIAHG